MNHTVEATVKNKTKSFESKDNRNLLAAALTNKVRIDHICRVGLCGTCQVEIVSGRDHLTAPTDQERLLLDETPLHDGVRLACQARVTGDVVLRQ